MKSAAVFLKPSFSPTSAIHSISIHARISTPPHIVTKPPYLPLHNNNNNPRQKSPKRKSQKNAPRTSHIHPRPPPLSSNTPLATHRRKLPKLPPSLHPTTPPNPGHRLRPRKHNNQSRQIHSARTHNRRRHGGQRSRTSPTGRTRRENL